MHARTKLLSTLTAFAAAAALIPVGGLADPSQSESNKRPFTTELGTDACTFVHDDTGSSSNPFWIPLIPGHQVVLRDDDEDLDLVITVCDGSAALCDGVAGTELVDGVVTRVIEERESEGGELKEISHNFFARCAENASIFYFGEDVDIFENGMVSHDGAWRADGVDNFAGVIMPGHFLLGSRYYQEIAPGIAEDRAENVALGLEVETPLDTYEGCARVVETSLLASNDLSIKEYCPGIGLVYDDGAELVGKNF